MGRSYFVEEAVGQYLSDFSTKPKACVTGLLIGQCSPQRDYVILAIRTPPRGEQNESNKNYPKLADIDEEWVTGHASQLSRMLPGGLLVLGVFIVAAPELAKDIQNALRKLVFSVEKSIGKKRLWNFAEEEVSDRVALHLCSATKKILCRTYDMQDPKSSAKPADWKYQSGLSAFWLSLECTINVNIHIPLSATSVNYELEKNTRKKSSRGNIQHSIQPFDVKVLTQLALKRDIINTLSDRCEILFEDLLINEAPEKKNSEREYHALPHRAFASIAGSNVMLCDYKFGDETAGEIQERFFEMLDQVVHGEAIHIAEEINIVDINPPVDNTDDTQQMQLTKATLLLKFQQNIGVVIAAAVAIFAVAFSFNYFSD
ncbi:protein odr-4 homolog isoform X4 [Gopherus evgoodei]|uniref:protein odr-4 homolog isoform X4 n=1 Tax=Gopherus evgoodei TaxID=1825980 RepID=UPI0011CFB415|nr:protein odr-4 homolog isoform X4 [Gopherus evgoodei]